MATINGIWTALVTPFDKKNQIDWPAFRKLVKRQVQAGVHGVIPCGTTGESPTLTLQEKKDLILATLEITKDSQTRVIAGTGSNNTQESISFSKWASDHLVDGVLLVTPYYNKPTQVGLIQHFTAIADAVDCEVMLYNVPGRTGIHIEPDTVVELARHKNITSLKEASGDTSLTPMIRNKLQAKNLSLQILSGDDPTFLSLMSVGGNGNVSVASNIIPEKLVEMYNLATQGQFEQANQIQIQLAPFLKDLFCEPNPVPAKYALEAMGFCSRETRLPLVSASDATVDLINRHLKQLGLLKSTQTFSPEVTP